MSAQKPSGSFFNQVPDKGEDDDASNDDNQQQQDPPAEAAVPQDPFEASLAQLMQSRNSESRASEPSTVGGIPTSKATGFGKESPKIIKTTGGKSGKKKSFVGIGKPMNDVNKPEYDDQGYTLYADEETGKKSRVFEALIEYPSVFKIKIIGANVSSFAVEMVQIVADSCSVGTEEIQYSERVNGKWLSVTVHAPVENAEMLYAMYENIDKDPRVKFKF